MEIDNENPRYNLIHAFSTQNAAGEAEGVPYETNGEKLLLKWSVNGKYVKMKMYMYNK